MVARLAMALLLGAGCAPASSQPGRCGPAATADVSPAEAGPFLVGYRRFETTYAPPGVDAPRTIAVNVWYPTVLGDGAPARYLEIWNDPASAVDATPAPPLDGCGYPVVAYSHGNTGFAGGGARLLRRFASHGWVAVAPDHTLNTIADQVTPLPTHLFYARALDVSAALDAVAALGPDDPLGGRVATDRALLAGHSLGTTTAWSMAGAAFDVDVIRGNCRDGGTVPSGRCTEGELAAFGAGVRDTRVVAAIPMAGSLRRDWFGPRGHESARIPLLQLTGGADDVGASAQWASLEGLELTWVELAGGCHETFNLGVCETLEPDEGTQLVATFALAFGRRHVLGDATAEVAGIVDGTRAVSEKATYRRR